jgi:hypothetical protein
MGGLIGHLRYACTPQTSTLVDHKQIVESTDLVPLDGDVAKINRRAEEFKELHDSLQRNLHTYLPLAMDTIVGVYQKLKVSSNTIDSSRQMVRAVVSYVSPSEFDLPPADTGSTEKEVAFFNGLCWHATLSPLT